METQDVFISVCMGHFSGHLIPILGLADSRGIPKSLSK
jgi:hypothetical protein